MKPDPLFNQVDHLAHRDFYYRHHGKPLVLTYLNGENAVVDTVEQENTFFTTRRIRAGRTDERVANLRRY